MTITIDETHEPDRRSWVDSANDPDADFPIQNLPFGRFRDPGGSQWRIGVAIGDQVLDLQRAGLIDHGDVGRLLAADPQERQRLRQALSRGLSVGSAQAKAWRQALHAQSAVELGLPCDIRDYTDFYIGIHHAAGVGRMFRPDSPLLPNYRWVPIGYHGRASTIQPSGLDFRRPVGQSMPPGAERPSVRPTQRLDFELELGIVIGRPNPVGQPITMHDAEDHVFGIALFNDWTARDIQGWEYQPLGTFLSKNFFSTLSPWIVTLDALAPFRKSFGRPAGDPDPLPYLDSPSNRERGSIDIELEVWLQTESMRRAGQPGDVLSKSNFADAAYWTIAQLVAHHTVNGCSLSTGDLFGSGTLSGPSAGQNGSLMEITENGARPIQLSSGESRTYLEDGDAIVLRGHCQRDGWRRIGFGECRATVRSAVS